MDDNYIFTDAYAPPSSYYKKDYRRPSIIRSEFTRKKAMSATPEPPPPMKRKSTIVEGGTSSKHVVMIDVEEVKNEILSQEDTDGDCQITVLDLGPKSIRLPTLSSLGHKKIEIRGTYMISNLLQEIGIAQSMGRKCVLIDTDRLNENPVKRLVRMIRTVFWDGLTRKMDVDGIERIVKDPKNRNNSNDMIVYVPHSDEEAYVYYNRMKDSRPDLRLRIVKLPKQITPEYVKSINNQFGILSLAANIGHEGTGPKGVGRSYDPIPFVVPGGRFNELYGWDSYFIILGLLIGQKIDLAKGIIDHFVYEINYYDKILNANRSYYLTRSQPPFLTDMALKVFEKFESPSKKDLEWLKTVFIACIKEYYIVWMSKPRYDPITGLSRFHPTGIGMPPETEATHYDHVFKPYADKLHLSIEEYSDKYNSGEIKEPELDVYFIHDRAVRESGHDTTYRLDKKCADLVTVDLNSLLYKYETDIAYVIKKYFGGKLEFLADFKAENSQAIYIAQNGYSTTEVNLNGKEKSEEMCSEFDRCHVSTFNEQDSGYINSSKRCDKNGSNGDKVWYRLVECADTWIKRSKERKERMDKYLWNPEKNFYFDYNIKKKRQSNYESATALYPLWAGCCSTDEQSDKLINQAMKLLKVTGGLLSGTLKSRGEISLSRPNRQWDYPFGWAPHQIMAWYGLIKYGRIDISRELAYRWLYVIMNSYVDYNGVVPEKFDVVSITHKVNVEYGNVGTDFKLVSLEGFGWMNSSIEIGLSIMTPSMRKALASLTHPDKLPQKLLSS
ncbi:hypothetical protein BB559_000921 [Furculomyces boomerangus]|uniref:Trehalase n=2 Tax=Harpellales TaxID=61421 RepID=A0A2T9Z3S5_9FUNG|nr:hypothetical protein BB559_000921 [Furculomyces boomerangus]PVZ96782.1 hypothetical protein BB558_007294 [Smittium angustum]PVZ98319.1 hypothetical protein BB558_005677 [Smittium angustum]